jgi:hypothetical protein
MITNPRWTIRADAVRPDGNYSDLLSQVRRHYDMYCSAEQFLGPYNAKARGKTIYVPPSRDMMRELIKQCGVNDVTYYAFLSSLVRFCETTKGNMALPLAHPSTVHSIQLPEGTFELRQQEHSKPVLQLGVGDPVELRGDVKGKVGFAILRPRMTQRGMTSATQWEALLFEHRHGYLPIWTDSGVNPRWAGSLT